MVFADLIGNGNWQHMLGPQIVIYATSLWTVHCTVLASVLYVILL